MKISHVLPLAALTTAFVIPDEQVMSQVVVESHQKSDSIFDRLPTKDQLVHEFDNTFSNVVESSKTTFDDAIELATDTVEKVSQQLEDTYFDTNAWIATEFNIDDEDNEHGGHDDHGRHPGHDERPGHGRGRHGRHGHSHKPNQTVYELIAGSKYTTKLAELINEYDDLVELLNGTAANYTVFAPIDRAFEKIPEGAPKPSKELLKKVLTYHVSSDFYPAGRVLTTHTVPTLLVGELLGGEAQRLSTNIGLKGLTVNFYSRIIAINIVSLVSASQWNLY